MVISKEYGLGENNYIKEIADKSQIMLQDTNKVGMTHFIDWVTKDCGSYKYTTPYTISVDGTIYEHFDSKYCSKIFDLKDIDNRIIPISLENEGQLTFNKTLENFITWDGTLYSGDSDKVYTKPWRGGFFWSPYTNIQIESLVKLVTFLSKKHDIPLKVGGVDDAEVLVEKYNGITFKHHYGELLTNINPSMNGKSLKEKIYRYEEIN